MLAGGPLSWSAYRSPVTPLSSCEGEYIAATKATTTTKGLRGLATFFGMDEEAATIVFCDNAAACMVSESNLSGKRLKHIATRIAYLQEAVKEQSIALFHIKTQGMLADIFTKPLTADQFHALRRLMVG